ncbi:PRC-barrel domain-containing protein [Klenkia sp. PcliD-1-E]|uniref:PRC-barrel domain-containing protein n=1 Tax=Klenkia sp. PcliD-1-E TaxID=2954492 RepID=UPI002097ECEF|nr:PRC-barrel domain-containing protein [Klenkia sp. PcliD-1-E]MCO7220919.1 PRC-barrel domain-containing protein [Klenkia sp. PcliD-1-E]
MTEHPGPDRTHPVLRPLRETGLTIADPGADVRGRTVRDRDGEDIGTVDEVLVDDQEEKVRMLRVAEGGFLGLGRTHYLVPVDVVVSTDDDEVRIDRSRTTLADVPGYDPDLTPEPDYASAYGWWGVGPFWGPGARWPGVPS